MTTKQPTNIDQELSMQGAFSELEEIVAEFETGNVDLEKSLPKFKKGLELAKFLKKRLKTLENEIEEIKEQYQEVEAVDASSEMSDQEDELPF